MRAHTGARMFECAFTKSFLRWPVSAFANSTISSASAIIATSLRTAT